MIRRPLTPRERARGIALGALLRRARGERTIAEGAADAGISPETLRKIETGRLPSPSFFTIVSLSRAYGLDLDAVARRTESADVADPA